MTKNTNYSFIMEANAALVRMSSLTGKIGFAIMRTRNALKPEIDIIDEMRNNLIKKYGKDGKIKPEDDGWNAFIKEYIDFLNDTKVDIEIHQIEPDEWNDDAVYCESAQAQDYFLVKSLLVK